MFPHPGQSWVWVFFTPTSGSGGGGSRGPPGQEVYPVRGTALCPLILPLISNPAERVPLTEPQAFAPQAYDQLGLVLLVLVLWG